MIAKADSVVWYASDREGFAAPVEIPLPHGHDAVPTVSADPELDLFFADMNGDGLTDVVRVQNGRVEYWPSLGNGGFSERVVLDGAPNLAADGEFDPARVRFVDLDGSGTTDVVYVGRGEVSAWINGAGNRLVPGPTIRSLPYIDNVSSARVLDFLADGRASLVWSSPLPGLERATAVLPLTPRDRPRLLLAVDDSRGRETRLSYSSSAAHYLRDRRSGRGWSTPLPHHRPVVDRIDVIDRIRGTRSTRRFEYRDGFFDGVERELRGFGQVDEYDGAAQREPVPDVSAAPTALTRTWFHLGTPMWHHHRLAGTYAGDVALPQLPPHVVADMARLEVDELEDALRGLAGTVLRRETYSLDAEGLPAAHPFEVHQATNAVKRVQPARGRARAAFLAVPSEELTATYEGRGDDPRVRHRVVLETDAVDFVTRAATIAYPRRAGVPRDLPAQDRQEIVVEASWFNHVDEPDRFQLGTPVQTQTLAVVGVRPDAASVFTPERLRAPDVAAALAAPTTHDAELPDDPTLGPRARLLSAERSFYWNDTRTAALPLGAVGNPLLAHHEEAACFSPETVQSVYDHRIDAARLTALGYALHDGLWWQVDPTLLYTPPAQFSLPRGVERADGATATVEYDAHAIELSGEIDAAGNRTTADIDFHVLAPWRITDANGYTQEVRYDPLGVVTTQTHQGRVGAAPWGFSPLAAVAPVTPATLAETIANAESCLQGAFRYCWYDLHAWRRDGWPIGVATFTREALRDDGTGGGSAQGRIQVAIAYLDGLGRTLQDKTLVDAGPAIQRDSAGAVVVDGSGSPVVAPVAARWHTSGHVMFDDRQRPVSTHQPFFSGSFEYEGDEVLRDLGPAIVTRTDALGRVVRRDFANGAHDATTYASWSVDQADPNDTVLESAYRAQRASLPATDPERQALDHAHAHAGTARTTFVDPAGRNAATLVRGGASGDRRAETRYDASGRVREVVDPRGLVAFTYRHDMQGRLLFQHGVDAGDTRALPDAYNRPALSWDARGFEVQQDYDAQDRLVRTHVRGGDGVAPYDHRVEARVYGDSLPDGPARNLRGRLAVIRDADGETAIDRADPGGRPLAASRRLRVDVASDPDWRQPVALETEAFPWTVVYDALGRPVREGLPDGTTRATEYSRSGLKTRVLVSTPDGQLVDTPVLDGLEHDARGQRTRLRLGNGVEIEYDYDPAMFRLRAQRTRRGSRLLQDCRYTYDPVGNIVRQVDEAQAGSAAILSNVVVDARRDFAYDAHYRLRRATGRVHQALLQHDYVPGTGGTFKGTRHLSLNNGVAIERYAREYDYDASGNLQRIRHLGASQSWTTEMWISPNSNRSLPAADPNGTPIMDPEARFDAMGNVRVLSHLRRIEWGWRGTLGRAVTIERPGGPDDDERYVYGADGLRTRRIQTRAMAAGATETIETIYLGEVERKRIRRAGELALERWSVHVSDGLTRIATIHRWTRDDLAREVDDVTRHRITYEVPTARTFCSLRLDESGDIVSYEEHFPYGGSAFVAGDRVREVDWSDYRYSGKAGDDATGLYCYGYRYYAPWMGRWLSPDPIGPEDDLNLYQFVRGDPIGHTDAVGLDSQPGQVKYVYIDPPNPWITDVESKITNWRTVLRGKERQGFDSLSREDQVRFVTADFGSVYLVPSDPQAPGGASGWSVLSREQFETTWLPARIKWAKQRGERVTIKIPTFNPARLTGSEGQGGGKPQATQASPPGQADKGKKTAGGRTGGDQGTADGSETGRGDTGRGAGKRGGGGEGSGGAGGPGGAGEGGTSGGIRGLEGSGTEASEVYGGVGGLAGGQSWGEMGGTPFSVGHTPGGRGSSPDETGAGNGLGAARGAGPGRGAGGGAGGTTTIGDGGSSRRDGTGAGGARANAPTGSRAPSATRSSPAAESSGNKVQSERGKPGGKGTHERTGWDVVVEMAGVTNLAFDEGSEKGKRHGIPGGLGLLKLEGKFIQALYVVTSVVSLILTVTGITALLAGIVGLIKGLFHLVKQLITRLPALLRLGLRAVRTLLARMPSLAGQVTSLASYARGAVTGSISRFRQWLSWGPNRGGLTISSPWRFGMWRGSTWNFALPWHGLYRFEIAVHEWVHKLAGYLPFNRAVQNIRLFGQPVGAGLRYIEEVVAYTLQHLSVLRPHGLLTVPGQAMRSVAVGYGMYGGAAAASKAVIWASLEVGVAAGLGINYLFLDEDDSPPPPSAGTP